MSERSDKQRFRDSQKMRMVIESWDLNGEALGRFMRTIGISSPELLSWREQMKDGLGNGKPPDRKSLKHYQNTIQLLEKEVRDLRLELELVKKSEEIRADAAAKREAQKSAALSARQSLKRKPQG